MFAINILKHGTDQETLYGRNLDAVIPMFNSDMIGHRTYILAQKGDEIVGVVSLTESTIWHENCLGVGYISTHVNYRNQGICKLLVDALFKYAKKSKRNISNSHYKPDGERYLRHVMQRTAARYQGVTLFERDA